MIAYFTTVLPVALVLAPCPPAPEKVKVERCLLPPALSRRILSQIALCPGRQKGLEVTLMLASPFCLPGRRRTSVYFRRVSLWGSLFCTCIRSICVRTLTRLGEISNVSKPGQTAPEYKLRNLTPCPKWLHQPLAPQQNTCTS